MNYFEGTIDAEARLELPVALSKEWLPTAAGRCVVVFRPPGCLLVTTTEAWAEAEGVSPKEAEATMESPWDHGLEPPELPKACFATVSRVNRKGPGAVRLYLPPLAVWALLGQGEGPKAPKGARRGTVVLLAAGPNSIFIWSDAGRAWLR